MTGTLWTPGFSMQKPNLPWAGLGGGASREHGALMIGGRALVTGTSGSPLAPSTTAALVGAPLQAPDRLASGVLRRKCPRYCAEAIASLENPSFLCLKNVLLAAAPPTEQRPAVAPVGPTHPQDSLATASFTRLSVGTINGEFPIPSADFRLPAGGEVRNLNRG